MNIFLSIILVLVICVLFPSLMWRHFPQLFMKEVTVPVSGSTDRALQEQWIFENCGYKSIYCRQTIFWNVRHKRNESTYYFVRKADVVSFKLRWA